MYGQGYRNKAERKSNSRFVVSEKNKLGYGQKKRADTPKMKSESQVVVDVRSISQSPRRLRAKYTHRTNFVYALRISPLQGAIIAGNGSKFVNGCQCIHSQIIWQNLLCRRQGGSAYRKKFIYSNDKTKQCKRQNHLYIQSCKTGKSLCSL